MKNKIFILLPDGVGLRNFAFTRFTEIGKNKGFDITFWNQTPFPVKAQTGFEALNIEDNRLHPLTSVYSRARKRIELKIWEKKFQDKVYPSYHFPQSYRGFKNALKSLFVDFLVLTKKHPKGLQKIIERIKKLERNTTKYKLCKQQLQAHRPAFVFCTNQRPTQAIAPILAARDLGIPTATFIFSWDNLPKATMALETDYYFVWSDHMKNELLRYYPQLLEAQVIITGTPQFEPHFSPDLTESASDFFNSHGLDLSKKYICFSGDDVTTSPDDAQYLSDTARAVQSLNNQGENLGILFRRCPVDISGRYEAVLKEFDNLIVPVAPKWKALGEVWNQIFPHKDDLALLANTARHTELVINLGSSMVFDFAAHNKPCVFIQYDAAKKKQPDWSVKTIYQYVHFRSMPTKEAVLWASNPDDLVRCIKTALAKPEKTVGAAQDWMQVINLAPPNQASQRIWEAIEKILQ